MLAASASYTFYSGDSDKLICGKKKGSEGSLD